MKLTKIKNMGLIGGSQKLGAAGGGFTLVELLIVIAIIGILAGAVLLVINPAEILRESRDTQRLSDLDTVAKAINLAIASEDIWPLVACTGSCSSAVASQSIDGINGWVTFAIPADGNGLGAYLSALPVDPSNGSAGTDAAAASVTFAYLYQSDATAGTFELNCFLEAADNLGSYGTDGGNAAGAYEVGTDPGLDLI